MPASDTQESTNAPKKSKMAILQPDIMFEIADILQREEFPKKSPVISRLLLINKHWEEHMKLHPLFSTAQFSLASFPFDFSKRASFEDVKKWLMHPDRRHRLIHSFSLTFDDDTDYHALCDLLDNQLSDAEFNTFKLNAWGKLHNDGLSEEDLQFPRSLKAHQLSIANLRRRKCFNWESLNLSLRVNLVSLIVSDRDFDPHNRDLAFKSLRKLDIDLVEDTDIHKWNDFLRRHSSINNLSICCPSEPEKRLPLQIDSLDNLETLELTDMMVDTTNKNIQHVPLKSLTYMEYRHPIKKWTGLSNTLEKLVIAPDDEVLEHDHDLLNPKMLYKLDNIKYFDYREPTESSRFARAFNSGLYDDAMPLVENFELMTPCVTKEALYRFIDKHKRLCRIEIACDWIDFTGNPRELRACETDEGLC